MELLEMIGVKAVSSDKAARTLQTYAFAILYMLKTLSEIAEAGVFL